MKVQLSALMIAIGMLAAAPLAPAYAASSKHPTTHARVYLQYPARSATSHVPARGAPSRGYEAYGYAPSGAYRAGGAVYPDGARSSYEEQLIRTTEDTY